MNTFTVPTLWKEHVLAQYGRLNELYEGRARIAELYGSHATSLFGSGRASLVLPRVSDRDLEAHVSLARKMGFSFNYLLNASCLGGREGTYEGQRELRALLRFLVNAGVDRVTVTSPMLIELVRSYEPGLRIGASVICYIDTVEKLLFFEHLGAERLSLDIDATRNFPLIRAMRGATGAELGLIVNSLCRIGCPLKTYHYNLNSHFSQSGHYLDEAGETKVEASTLHYVGGRCMLQNHREKASVIKTAWVRPEDLHHYSRAGINLFKVQGRGSRPENMLKTVEMYMAGRAPSRVLPMALFAGGRFGFCLDNRALDGFLEFFVQEPYRCERGCDECRYCYEVAERAVIEDEAAVEELLSEAGKMVGETLAFDRQIDRISEALLERHLG